jgi:heme oxygenase
VTTQTTTPSTDDFAARLRRATSAEHERAAMSPYMAALVGGELGRDDYARLVVQHHHVYAELESAAEAMRHHPVAGAFVDDRLKRRAALAEDLQFLLGPDWRGRADASPATEAYVARMRDVCHTHPARFVAHHYTRYLGDLAGGQFVRRSLEATFGDGSGIAFYRFEGLDPKAYLAHYRTLLASASWSEDEEADLVDEALVAYRHNRELLADLDAAVR